MTVSIFTLYILTSFTILSDMPVASGQTLYIKTDKTPAESYFLLLNGFLILRFPSFLHEPHAAGQIFLLTKIGNWKSLHYPFPFQSSPLETTKGGFATSVGKTQALPITFFLLLMVQSLVVAPVVSVFLLGVCFSSFWGGMMLYLHRVLFKQESPWPRLLYFCIFQNGLLSWPL